MTNTANWIAATGVWDLATNWSTGVIPGATTNVVIDGGDVTSTEPDACLSLSLSGGSLTIQGSNAGFGLIGDGSLADSGDLIANNSSIETSFAVMTAGALILTNSTVSEEVGTITVASISPGSTSGSVNSITSTGGAFTVTGNVSGATDFVAQSVQVGPNVDKGQLIVDGVVDLDGDTVTAENGGLIRFAGVSTTSKTVDYQFNITGGASSLAGGIEIGTADDVTAGALTIDSGVDLVYSGALGSTSSFPVVVDNGVLEAASDESLTLYAVGGSGTLQIDKGATLTIGEGTNTIHFVADAGATLNISDYNPPNGAYQSSISGFDGTDLIDWYRETPTNATSPAPVSSLSYSGDAAGGVLTLNYSGAPAQTLSLVGDYLNDTFYFTNLSTGFVQISLSAAAATVSVATFLADQTTLNKNANGFSIADTAANVLANLGALNADTHIDSISLTDGGTPTLTLSLAQALDDTTALGKIVTPFKKALSDTGANIAALTSTQIAALEADGYTTVSATTPVTLSFAEANSLASDKLAITGKPVTVAGTVAAVLALTVAQADAYVSEGYAFGVLDSAADIEALTAAQIAGLAVRRVTTVTSSSGGVKLTEAQAATLESALVEVVAPSGSTVTLADTGSNIEMLTAAQIADLPEIGVTAISSSSSVVLNVAQALMLEGLKLTIAVPTGDYRRVADSAANIEAMTATQIAGLTAIGVTAISSSGSLVLTVAQAVALEGIKLTIAVPTGDTQHIADTAANIDAMTATQIAGLAAIGVSNVTSTGSGLTLSVAQADAFLTAGVSISLPSGAIKDLAAKIESLTTAQIAGLTGLHVAQITATDVGVVLTVAQAAALESAKVGLAAPTAKTNSIEDTAARIATLTTAQIAGLSALGVKTIEASDATLGETAAQAVALETAGIKLSAPTGSVVEIADTAANLQNLTTAQIGGLKAIGVTELYATNASVSYTAAQTSAIVSAGLAVAATGSDTVTENLANGGYSTYEKGVLSAQKTVNADGSYDIANFGITGQSYTSDEYVYNSSAAKVAFATNNTNGTGALTIYVAGVTVSVSPSQLSVASPGDVFTLSAHATEAITATTGDLFIFSPASGARTTPWQDTIAGFTATGTTHDTLEFSASAFGATVAQGASADLAALLSHTAQGASGAAIADIYGDSLTLSGVTKTILSANAGDFKFV